LDNRTCILGFPPLWSPQRCHLREEVRVDDKVTEEVKEVAVAQQGDRCSCFFLIQDLSVDGDTTLVQQPFGQPSFCVTERNSLGWVEA